MSYRQGYGFCAHQRPRWGYDNISPDFRPGELKMTSVCKKHKFSCVTHLLIVDASDASFIQITPMQLNTLLERVFDIEI